MFSAKQIDSCIMKTNAMNLSFSFSAFTALLTAAASLAWQTPVGPAPAPVFIDMERSTNVQIQAETIQQCRVFECSLAADGADNAFSAIIDLPPDWMFSHEWDAIRLTVRGACDSAENASVRFGPNPAFIILR